MLMFQHSVLCHNLGSRKHVFGRSKPLSKTSNLDPEMSNLGVQNVVLWVLLPPLRYPLFVLLHKPPLESLVPRPDEVTPWQGRCHAPTREKHGVLYDSEMPLFGYGFSTFAGGPLRGYNRVLGEGYQLVLRDFIGIFRPPPFF